MPAVPGLRESEMPCCCCSARHEIPGAAGREGAVSLAAHWAHTPGPEVPILLDPAFLLFCPVEGYPCSMSNNLTNGMTLDQALAEWKSKRRRMGCVSATDFLCKRVPGFRPIRLTRYLESGELYEHVVATDGLIIIDLAPYADRPSS